MLEKYSYYHALSPTEDKKARKLTARWLKYYSNWNGTDYNRDNVIKKKVNKGLHPPNCDCGLCNNGYIPSELKERKSFLFALSM